MDTQKLISQNLLQIKAIKLNLQNPFTWASGMRSPIYCDNRVTLSYPEVRNNIKNGLATLAKSFGEIDMVSGVATAGIAHGALLADTLGLPFSYVRSAPKSHGRQNQIEGEIFSESKILVVEDLISTGGSSLEAVEILREHGHQVIGVIAIFDYQFDIAQNNFANSNCVYKTLSHYSALLQEALSSGYIDAEEAQILALWSQDPKNWYDNYIINK